MSTIELPVTGLKNERNVHSASNISPHMAHNSDTQLLPEAATSNRFLSSYSIPATAIDLPRYPLQAHINNYPPPQVVDTTLAPSPENVAMGSFLPVCAQPHTGTRLDIVRTFSSSIYP